MNTYASPYQIGLGDSVNYNFKNYLVLTNYIKGETDAKGYTPKSNRTILIDDNDNRIVCDDFTKLRKKDCVLNLHRVNMTTYTTSCALKMR